MQNSETDGFSSTNNVKIKKRCSRGKECAVFGCSNTMLNKHLEHSGFHFFTFPKTKLEINRWCNLIKKQNGKDAFNVTKNTVVCNEHFRDCDIKKGMMKWKLKEGAEPSLKLFEAFKSSDKIPRKPPSI